MFCVPVRLEPSNDCGPFKTQDHVYNILTSRVGDLPMWLRDVIVYASTPAIVVPIILLLLYVSTTLCTDFTYHLRSLCLVHCAYRYSILYFWHAFVVFSPFIIIIIISMEICKVPNPRLKALNKDSIHRVKLDRECYPQFNQS